MQKMAAARRLIEHGQPRYGRLASAPSDINLADFDYVSPYGRPKFDWQKRLAFKQFQFISLNNAEWMIGVAVVDLGWVGNGFFYAHHRPTGQTIEHRYLQPMARQTHLDRNPNQGQSRFQKGSFSIQIDKNSSGRQVTVQHAGQVLLAAWIDQTTAQAVNVCTPTGINGWTYTQKNTTLTAQGRLCVAGQAVAIVPQTWQAATDDTCGILRPDTAWHWLSLSAILPDGTRLGLNLSNGVNETFVSENTLWINGQPSELPAVLFVPKGEQQWHIYSADGAIDLAVETGWCLQESINAGVVGSHFRQWVSVVRGKVTLARGEQPRQLWTIDEQMGLLEKHFARW